MENAGSAIVDFGRFCTGFLVVMGVGEQSSPLSIQLCLSSWNYRTNPSDILALPVLLAHCGRIVYPAMAMSIVGGLLIYGTIISFSTFFQEEQDF